MRKQEKDNRQRYVKKKVRKVATKNKKIKWLIKGIQCVICVLVVYLIVRLGIVAKEIGKTDSSSGMLGWIGENQVLQQMVDKIAIFETKEDKGVYNSEPDIHEMDKNSEIGTMDEKNGITIDDLNENGNKKTDTTELEQKENGTEKFEISQTGKTQSMLSEIELTVAQRKIKKFANEHQISTNAYPNEFVELLGKNAEAEEFVLQYPFKKGTYSKQPLLEYLNKEEIPLLMQWDERFGYYEYGSNVIGITGCGPTCLSMVAIHLLQNPTLTPIYMAEYAQQNGYYVQGIGTSWEFMSRGASQLGLSVRELPLDENRIKQHLQNGNPIICIMGEGDFTDKGHFIVLTGLQNGKIKVNDPNSRSNSKKLWKFEEIKSQIKNLWVYFI